MDFVELLRELEGINISFDYGVELVAMAVKRAERGNFDDIKYQVYYAEMHLGNLFDYDKVCSNGFDIAKQKLMEAIDGLQ